MVYFQVCWIPVLKAKKLVLAGDPLQLGPTIISEGNDRRFKQKFQNLAKETTSDARGTAAKAKANVQPTSSVGIRTPIVTEREDKDLSGVSDSSSSETDEVPTNPPEDRMVKDTGNKTSNHSLLRPPKSLNTTLFDRLEAMYGSAIKRMLNVQYRFV
jgi:DNA polymerase alpha-associated DNA helicase A